MLEVIIGGTLIFASIAFLIILKKLGMEGWVEAKLPAIILLVAGVCSILENKYILYALYIISIIWIIGITKNIIIEIKERKTKAEEEQKAIDSLKKAMGDRFLHLPK